jgi:hypothetical protein
MPFAETFLAGADPENINHFGGFRMRVQGDKHLLMTLYTLDRVRSSILLPLGLDESDQTEPLRLSNFSTQRCIFRTETNEFDAFMKFNRIIFFVKPIYTQGVGNR